MTAATPPDLNAKMTERARTVWSLGDFARAGGNDVSCCYDLLLVVVLVALRPSLRMLLRRAAAGAAAALLAAAALALAAAVVLVALRAGTARFFGVELVGVARSVCRLAAFGCDLAQNNLRGLPGRARLERMRTRISHDQIDVLLQRNNFALFLKATGVWRTAARE